MSDIVTLLESTLALSDAIFAPGAFVDHNGPSSHGTMVYPIGGNDNALGPLGDNADVGTAHVDGGGDWPSGLMSHHLGPLVGAYLQCADIYPFVGSYTRHQPASGSVAPHTTIGILVVILARSRIGKRVHHTHWAT